MKMKINGYDQINSKIAELDKKKKNLIEARDSLFDGSNKFGRQNQLKLIYRDRGIVNAVDYFKKHSDYNVFSFASFSSAFNYTFSNLVYSYVMGGINKEYLSVFLDDISNFIRPLLKGYCGFIIFKYVRGFDISGNDVSYGWLSNFSNTFGISIDFFKDLFGKLNVFNLKENKEDRQRLLDFMLENI